MSASLSVRHLSDFVADDHNLESGQTFVDASTIHVENNVKWSSRLLAIDISKKNEEFNI